MIFCGRCDTWCYDLREHQDNGECELVQRVREAENEVKSCTKCAEHEKMKLKLNITSSQRFTVFERMR